MKKIIFILLCVFIFIPVVYAAPKKSKNTRSLESIKITETSKKYEPEDKLYLDFKMVTDSSNVDNVTLLFRSANYNSYFLAELKDINNQSYVEIPKYIESNYYTISRLTINYKDGTSGIYSQTGVEPLSNKYDFDDDYIYIGNNVDNELSISIKNVRFSSQSIISGSSINMSLELDSAIDIDQVNTFVIITDGVNVKRINLNGNKTNLLMGNIIVTGTETTYYVDSITIADKNSSSKTFYYKNEELNDKKSFCDTGDSECLNTIISFKLENNTNEEETPVLSSVKFSKRITTSDAKIFVDATDNGSGINSVAVTLYNINDEGVIDLDSKITTNMYYDNLLEEYVGMLNFANRPFGKYYIFKIELLDNQNTTKEVCLNNCDIESTVNLNNYKYDTIEFAENNNEVLSLEDGELIEKIKNSKDNNTIVIDISNNTIAPKELFGAIQNTNKTLVFKRNGIEWIFNGNDIERLKEVDLSFRTSIYDTRELGKDFVALEFADNGKLPGKAKIRIDSSYTYQFEKGNDKVNIYYVNGNKFSEIDNNISVSEDGYYEFEIINTSTYIISDKRISESLLVKDEEIEEDKNNDDNKVKTKKKESNLPLIILIAIPSVFLIATIIIYCIKTIKMRNNSLENYVVDDPIIATPLEEDDEDEVKEEKDFTKYKSKGNR